MFTTLGSDIQRALKRAQECEQIMHDSGLTPKDTATGCWPFEEVQAELMNGLRELELMYRPGSEPSFTPKG